MIVSDEILIGELKDQLCAINPEIRSWLNENCARLVSPGEIYLTFSMVPRFVPRNSFQAGETGRFHILLRELGHNPDNWTCDQVGRLIVLLSAGRFEGESFAAIIRQLLDTADIYEQVSIYKSLMFLPFKDLLVERVVDGVRTNINDVFEAIALENAYPGTYFEELAWNQLVLKALFTSKPIRKIIGIDKRNNPRLARMALGLAHERRAAGRMVNPDLWRLMRGYLDEKNIEEIKRLLSGTDMEKKAAILLCREAVEPAIAGLIATDTVVDFTWDDIN